MVGFEKQTDGLAELNHVTDVVTMKTSSNLNSISKSDEELVFNTLLGLSAFWNNFPDSNCFR